MPKQLTNCIEKIKKLGKAKNPWAICIASLGPKGSGTIKYSKKDKEWVSAEVRNNLQEESKMESDRNAPQDWKVVVYGRGAMDGEAEPLDDIILRDMTPEQAEDAAIKWIQQEFDESEMRHWTIKPLKKKLNERPYSPGMSDQSGSGMIGERFDAGKKSSNFREGDRVMFVGQPFAVDMKIGDFEKGTVVKGHGISGRSIYSDPVHKMVFVDWDNGEYFAVFKWELEKISDDDEEEIVTENREEVIEEAAFNFLEDHDKNRCDLYPDSPSCPGGGAKYRIFIDYSGGEGMDTDVLNVCSSCKDRIVKDLARHPEYSYRIATIPQPKKRLYYETKKTKNDLYIEVWYEDDRHNPSYSFEFPSRQFYKWIDATDTSHEKYQIDVWQGSGKDMKKLKFKSKEALLAFLDKTKKSIMSVEPDDVPFYDEKDIPDKPLPEAFETINLADYGVGGGREILDEAKKKVPSGPMSKRKYNYRQETADLKELFGKHWLTGVDKTADSISLTLDGITYTLTADKIVSSKAPVRNKFPRNLVVGSFNQDTLLLVDVKTGAQVVSVTWKNGKLVCNFSPNAMSINKTRKPYGLVEEDGGAGGAVAGGAVASGTPSGSAGAITTANVGTYQKSLGVTSKRKYPKTAKASVTESNDLFTSEELKEFAGQQAWVAAKRQEHPPLPNTKSVKLQPKDVTRFVRQQVDCDQLPTALTVPEDTPFSAFGVALEKLPDHVKKELTQPDESCPPVNTKCNKSYRRTDKDHCELSEN
jgi:hypothetical protein